MLILTSIESESGNRASKLRHSWIKHLILERDGGAIAELRHGPQPERVAFENRLSIDGDFDNYIAEARLLARTMVEGFSPIQVLRSELRNFHKEAKESILSALHDLYLKETGINEQIAPMEHAIDSLENEIVRFRGIWFSGADQNIIREGFKEIQLRATNLDEILNKLPKGIVLP